MRERPAVPMTADLAASGVLDALLEQIDAGQLHSGTDGLIPESIKGALERGLQAEMSSHLGYQKGDLDIIGECHARAFT